MLLKDHSPVPPAVPSSIHLPTGSKGRSNLRPRSSPESPPPTFLGSRPLLPCQKYTKAHSLRRHKNDTRIYCRPVEQNSRTLSNLNSGQSGNTNQWRKDGLCDQRSWLVPLFIRMENYSLSHTTHTNKFHVD